MLADKHCYSIWKMEAGRSGGLGQSQLQECSKSSGDNWDPVSRKGVEWRIGMIMVDTFKPEDHYKPIPRVAWKGNLLSHMIEKAIKINMVTYTLELVKFSFPAKIIQIRLVQFGSQVSLNNHWGLIGTFRWLASLGYLSVCHLLAGVGLEDL